MKKSINAWSVDSKANFEDMFAQIKKAGFDGIELNIDGEGRSAHSLSLDMTNQELKSKVMALGNRLATRLKDRSAAQLLKILPQD